MTATRTLLLASLGLALFGCATGGGVSSLRVDARQMGGVETTATLEIPEGWYQSSKRPDRLTFSAPDNFTTLTFSTQSVRGDGSQCPDIARSVAAEAAKGGQLMAPAEDVTDWNLTIPASPPGPSDRYVQGRAMCRKGALAVVSCSTGVKRKDSTGLECAKILASLAIGGETGPVPTSVTLPVAAGAGSGPAPAAAASQASPATAPTGAGVPVEKAAEKAAREMPAAAMTDAALEKDFLDAFASQKWDGTALKAVITDKDWNIVKNEVTGAVLRRWLGAAVAYELPDGSCRLRSVSIEQPWDGLAYGKSRFSGQGIEQHDIDCAKVK